MRVFCCMREDPGPLNLGLMDSYPNLCLSDSEPGIYRLDLEGCAHSHLLCAQCQWWPHTSPCPLDQMHTVGSEHTEQLQLSVNSVQQERHSQGMCHQLALLRGAVTSSLLFEPSTWYKTSLRPGGMVSQAIGDKKLEISAAIDDPRTPLLSALPGNASPVEWVLCVLPSPEEHYTFFALMWSVGGGKSGPEEVGLMLASIHLAPVVPALLKTGKVWQ